MVIITHSLPTDTSATLRRMFRWPRLPSRRRRSPRTWSLRTCPGLRLTSSGLRLTSGRSLTSSGLSLTHNGRRPRPRPLCPPHCPPTSRSLTCRQTQRRRRSHSSLTWVSTDSVCIMNRHILFDLL